MIEYKVQVGYRKGKYTTRWSFMNKNQAIMWYNALNVFNEYKKRLLENGKVIAREITTR